MIFEWIASAWRGEEELWEVIVFPIAFWILFAVLFTMAIAGFGPSGSGSGSHAMTPTSGWFTPTRTWWISFISFAVEAVINLPFIIWQTVAVWRCGRNNSEIIWRVLTNLLMAFLFVHVALSFYGNLKALPALVGNKAALYKLTCEFNMGAYYNANVPKDRIKKMQQYIEEHQDDLNYCIKTYTEKDAAAANQPDPSPAP